MFYTQRNWRNAELRLNRLFLNVYANTSYGWLRRRYRASFPQLVGFYRDHSAKPMCRTQLLNVSQGKISWETS